MYQSLIPPIASYKKGEPHLTSSDIDILCLWKLSEHNELFVVVLRRELKCSGHFDRTRGAYNINSRYVYIYRDSLAESDESYDFQWFSRFGADLSE